MLRALGAEREGFFSGEATPSGVADADALEAWIWTAYREMYSTAVRRVAAAIKREGIGTFCDAGTDERARRARLRGFVDRAITPAESVLGRRAAREVQVVALAPWSDLLRVTPPLPEDAGRLALYIPNVLDEAACTELIERSGLEQASVPAPGERACAVRGGERAVVRDAALAARLWGRVEPHVPALFDGQPAAGLGEELRVERCPAGQGVAQRVDDPAVLDGRRSRFTLLLHLNEGFDGGCTRLCVLDDREVDRSIDVQPATGAAFVFDQRILHAGMPVSNGAKYVLRGEVLYATR